MRALEIRRGPLDEPTALAAGALCARAFAGDALFESSFPSTRRDRAVAVLHARLLSALAPIAATAAAFDGETLVGLSVFLPPGAWPLPPAVQWRSLGAALRAASVARVRPLRGARLGAEAARHHPTVPHWYLQLLAVEPSWQRRGVGTALLRAGLAACDAEGRPAYLETQRAENLPYYARFGFTPVAEVRGEGEVRLWCLVRRAAASS